MIMYDKKKGWMYFIQQHKLNMIVVLFVLFYKSTYKKKKKKRQTFLILINMFRHKKQYSLCKK